MRPASPRRLGRRAAAFTAAGAMASACFVGTTLPAVAADEVQLVVNGGFESGLSQWFVNNGNATDGGTLSVASSAFAGTGAVTVTGRTTTGSGPMQDLSGKLQAGGTYTVTARVRYDNAASPATKQFFATMHYGGATYTNVGTVTADRGEWALLTSTFTIPATQNVATARLFFETPWVNGETAAAAPAEHLMDFSVDEVTLTGAAAPEPPAAPSKTIEALGKLPGEHNPLISHKFGADGFGFAHDGRVYMYMTNDTQGYAPDPVTGVSPQINYGDINQITVISSEDLVNWTDHGEVPVAGPNGVAPFTNNSWAPGMASKVVDGEEKFFLYYANGGASSNVITGESPIGPWTSERTSPLITGATPGAAPVQWLFDPAPFVDEDGQAYLMFGGGPAATTLPAEERFNNPKNLRAIELGDDMVSTEGSAVVVDAPVAFEAGHVFEREGKYYFSYSSHFGGPDFGGNQPRVPGYPGGGQIGYMMSDDPMTWPKETYAGVLFPNQQQFFGPGTGGNNHQSVFEFDGKYYFTYHAPTLNKRINGDATQGYRSPHIQELAFNADGTIQQVVGTYAGAEQVRDFDPYRTFEAETIAWQQGLTTRAVDSASAQFGEEAPNLVLTDIDAGDWTSLSSVDFGATGAGSVSASVRSLSEGAEISVHLDDPESEAVATLTVGDAADEWTEVTAQLDGVTGVHDVYFTFAGAGEGDLVEVDTWSFAAAEEPVTPGFVDVPADGQFGADIAWLVQREVAEGYTVGDERFFYPTAPMSRQAMAAFLYRYAGDGWEPAAGTRSFVDVPADHPFHTEIEWMKARGFATGYAGDVFGATWPVSRQATAAFLHRLAEEPEVATGPTFTDVPADHPFAEAIAWAEQSGVVQGYDGTTFGMSLPVTRQAMAAFLHRYDTFVTAAAMPQ